MKKKIAVASLLLFVVAFSSFAEARFYIKGTYGGGFRTRDWGVITATDTDGEVTTQALGEVYSALSMMLTPAFGVTPWADSKNVFLNGLSFEISADVSWGSAYGLDAGPLATASSFRMYSVTPTIMAVYGHKFGKILPYCGIGASVPILFSWEFDDSTYNGVNSDGYTTKTDWLKVGWNINVMAGLGYALTETVTPVIEVVFGWGYEQGMGLGARFGLVFALGKNDSAAAGSDTDVGEE